jgi:hypothetical protein
MTANPGNLDAVSDEITARCNFAPTECDDAVRIATALRHFDLRFGCNVPLLLEFIGSSPDQIPREFDPSPARLHGTDLIALLRLMRL